MGVFVFLFVLTSYVSAVDIDDRNIFEKIWDFLFNYGEEPQLAPEKSLDQDLVLHLPFGSDYLDASTNGYNVICAAGYDCPATDFDFLGNATGAYYFDGFDILQADNAHMNSLTENYTFAFWINLASIPPASPNNYNVLSTEHDLNPVFSGYVFDMYPSGFYFYPSIDNDDSNNLVSLGLPSVGIWTHYAVTYDGITLRAYVDGVEVDSFVGEAHIIPNAIHDLHIGSSSQPAKFLNASLDDLRIYSKALDATEVWALRGICTDVDDDGWVAEENESYCTYHPNTLEIVSDDPPIPYFNDCDDIDNTKMELHDLYNDGDGDGHGVDPSISTICESWDITYPRFETYLTTNGYSTDNTDCDDVDVDRFQLYNVYDDTDGDYYGVEPISGTLCSASALSNLAMLQADQIANGVAIGSGDCNNNDPAIYPTATEINDDGIDQNCDGYDGRSCVMDVLNPPFPENNACDGLSECHTDWWCLPNVCNPQTVLADGTACTGGICQAGVCVSNLILHMPFDGNIFDYSGKGFNGNCNGDECPTLTLGQDGIVDGAYEFDGINDRIVVLDDDLLDLTSDFSILVWTKFNSLIDSDPRTVISKEFYISDFNNAGYVMEKYGVNNLYFVNYGNSAPLSNNVNAPIIEGEWHHSAVTYNSTSGEMKMYYDAVEVASNPSVVNVLPHTVDLHIGTATALNRFFNGSLDDLRIYQGVLSQPEIQTIMGGPSCTDGDGDGYVAESLASGCDTSGIVPFNGYDDCEDGDINIFPGQTEDCGNGIDDNCDTFYDYGENNDPTFRLGDEQCTVSVDTMGVAEINPLEGTSIGANCNTSVFSEGTEALVEGVGPCSFVDFSCGGSDSICNFNCNVGSAGVKDVVCYIDGRVDHQFGLNLSTTITVQAVAACNDGDGDGWVLESAASGCDTSGIIPFNGYDDCDDIVATTYPGATETCDNVDNDCSAGTADGFDEVWYGQSTICGLGVCESSGILDCIDGKQEDTCTELPPQGVDDQSCDGLDNNCDGFTDEDYVIDSSCFLPGECAAGNVASSCVAGVETSCSTGTPDTEICDGLDNDCSGVDDDNLVAPLNVLQDGVCAGSVQTCNGVLGWFDDYSGVVDYEATELTCDDSLNNDCDLTTDCGDSDCSANPACIVQTYPDSYILDLSTGWNYVSVPLRHLLEDGVSKFNSEIVLEYTDGWNVNYKDVLSDIGVIEPLKGYVVYSASDQSIVFNGTLNETYSYPLGVDNWNLVGSSTDAYGFDGNQLFNDSAPILPGDVLLGDAYWVYTGSEPQLAPPSAGFWDFLVGLFKY